MSRFKREGSAYDVLHLKKDSISKFKSIARDRGVSYSKLLDALMGTFDEVSNFYDGRNGKQVTPFLKQLERLLYGNDFP